MVRKINDKKELYKLIAFLVMGDGGVYRSSKKGNAYFVMTQSEKHKDFSDYAKDILDNVAPVKLKYINRQNESDGCNRSNQYRLESRTHPIYTKMRDAIYVDKYKSLSSHYLKSLDWESLAILYMSDGSMQTDFRPNIGMANPSYRVTLNLKRLSEGDLLMLRKVLIDKEMGMWNVNRQKQYFFLTLKSKFIPLFMSNIASYVLPSFQYKVHPEYRTISPSIEGGDIV